jgi:hypothetical protein
MITVKVLKVRSRSTLLEVTNENETKKVELKLSVNYPFLDQAHRYIILANVMISSFIGGIIVFNITHGQFKREDVYVIVYILVLSFLEVILFELFKQVDQKITTNQVKYYLQTQLKKSPKWFVICVLSPLYGEAIYKHANKQQTDQYVRSQFRLRQVSIE